ncbi:hypothetical protein OROGR_029525 [Orobanche gracilis]
MEESTGVHLQTVMTTEKYEVLELVESAYNSDVHKARNRDTGETVILKVIPYKPVVMMDMVRTQDKIYLVLEKLDTDLRNLMVDESDVSTDPTVKKVFWNIGA